MVSTDAEVGEPELKIADLDWMSRGILTGLNEAGGTADTTEIRTKLGVKGTGSINHRIDDYLKPAELIETLRPEPDKGRSRPKVLSLTSEGEEMVEMIREVESGDDEEGRLPLDQRLERLESAL
jgi:DNA-binding MarR family transcriptional regulator